MTEEKFIKKTGVTSKILWHFTGGPKWNEKFKKQNTKIKPAMDAYKALFKILKTKELKIGSYREIIRSNVDIFHFTKNQTVFIDRNTPKVIESSPVCCVSDIPIQHLDYHSIRYGKFAIGFYRNALLKNNFNPVFYTFDSKPIIGEIMNVLNISQSLYKNLRSVNSYFNQKIKDIDLKEEYNSATFMFNSQTRTIQDSLSMILSFVKTIEEIELQTIYSEREWRSIQPFKFNYNDVAMVILPKKISNTNYFDKFIEGDIKELQIPRKIPIVTWDDLIEH